MSGWGTPKNDPPFELTEKDLAALKAVGAKLRPVLRVGFKKKISPVTIAKTNSHLGQDQIIKVEFIQISGSDVRKCSEELARETKSRVIEIHGNFVILFRKHPSKTLDEIYK